MFKMVNAAIIGSNGFIGKHLTERLLKEKSVNLFLFGRSDISDTFPGLSYKKIDFINSEAIKKDFKDIDIIYYLASETIPASSWDTPMIEIEKNLVPYINFLEIISQLKVKKIAFVSSAGTIYGATVGKVQEEFNKSPFSPYGIIKLTMENFLNYYKTKYNLQYDVYRVSNVYGEGQNVGKGLGIINTFLENILKDNEVKVFGDGKSTRNYIYVKDVAELLTLTLSTITSSDIYNISSDSTHSINDLIKIMEKVVSEKFKVVFVAGRPSDNSYIDLDNSKILKTFKDFRFTKIETGIENTYFALKKAKVKT